ncbi:MAG: bifunctional [glutamate--ammonia ligase]-adenylyl-L-tyrosine phosphorylase/[glutamate--ammonia-ligase] adenylyltransferase, partial [Nitrospirae bacterium]|nr:bifunctional [glutamate--ammonia ligase]-adenylyl-L-tyrosine phosphorylase/[glutamate--ammonia-ligase] adenylyltransferase [Nitrospirota bacterium]
ALEKKSPSQLREELLAQLTPAASFPEKMDALRKFKYTEEIRIGLMDLRKVLTLQETLFHLSTLADLCVEGALLMAKGDLEPRFGCPMEREEHRQEAQFGVIAVGKFGSSEITYGSDLDLFFIYSDEGQTTGPRIISNHEYFSQLASKLVSALTVITREGSVFKVDTRLRPAGSKGPLSQSLETFQNYMEQEASVWELQAMTRARPAAGDAELGERFVKTCRRIIFPFSPREDLAREIYQMRERMLEEVSKEDVSAYDIKIGSGGIVDIEFLVQYFLLSEGGRHPAIRETHTWKALKPLRQESVISDKDYAFLKRAYTFLRTLESRLRMVSNLPSHLLPKEPSKVRSIALRMGYGDTPRGRAENKLLQNYLRIRKGVREMFERILNPNPP